MKRFTIIAFTHKHLELEDVGKLHLDDTVQAERLRIVKASLDIDELMYVSTCNRVEFFIVSGRPINSEFVTQFFDVFAPHWSAETTRKIVNSAEIFTGRDAINHSFRVASSLDSMVIGEREIITQVRNAYETSKEIGLTGDFIRLVVKHTVETAKQVYTDTDIAKNPVSVVSLAYRQLIKLNVKLNARILVIGAGKTNGAITKFLYKHGYSDFTVFNRTLTKAALMAAELDGISNALTDLPKYNKGFDVIITCTASNHHIITKDIYSTLVGNDSAKKVVIDLAIPNDFDQSIINEFPVHLIQVSSLKEIAQENIKIREKELVRCNAIIEQHIEEFNLAQRKRKLEVALTKVPQTVKEIHQKALSEVFAKDIAKLDKSSKEVLDKVLAYVEKKYISVPMKMAREILIENE
ncbi:MAG: glutamyl-tRNA reductase [Flavobacteriales bacterium]|nr:glutamyl-tRNA reductase [Flavobacteriales bacterium]